MQGHKNRKKKKKWLFTQRCHVPQCRQEGLSEYHLCPVWSRHRESTKTKGSGLGRRGGTSSRSNTESASETRWVSLTWESWEGSEMSWRSLSLEGHPPPPPFFFFWNWSILKGEVISTYLRKSKVTTSPSFLGHVPGKERFFILELQVQSGEGRKQWHPSF